MNPKLRDRLLQIGLLVLRVGAGSLLFYGHGLPKLLHFSERAPRFSDPLGVGSPTSLGLVVLAEVFCSIAVVLGFATRLAAVPLVGFFLIAVFIHHAADPFKQKELAMIYAIPFLTLLLTGPGRYSIDAWIGGRLGRGRSSK